MTWLWLATLVAVVAVDVHHRRELRLYRELNRTQEADIAAVRQEREDLRYATDVLHAEVMRLRIHLEERSAS